MQTKRSLEVGAPECQILDANSVFVDKVNWSKIQVMTHQVNQLDNGSSNGQHKSTI